MKQVIQSYRSGELWLADVPAPASRSGGAVVQTAASAVSAGTERLIIELAKKSLIGKAQARPDLVKKVISKIKTEGVAQTMEKVFAKLDTPIPLGYSCAGTIIESGEGASLFRPGDRVACAGAGFATHAEFNYTPKNLLVKIPANVIFEDASFTTLGAIAMQGVRQSDVRIGETVAVIGLGLIGLLTVQILKSGGCQVLGSDPDAGRCKLAEELGADRAVSEGLVDAAAAFSYGNGIDAVIITAATDSNQPIEQAAEISRMKGRVVVVGMVGMDVPRDLFYKKELDLRLSMSYGPGRYDPDYEEGGHDYPIGYVRWTEQRNMSSFMDLVASGKVTPSKLITHRFSIDRALDAYAMLESSSEPYLGIVIDYPQSSLLKTSSRLVELRSMKPSSQIRAGFIGAGNFAKGVLIPALKKIGDVELAGICTLNGVNASEAGKKHGFAFATTDPQAILESSAIDAVFIATRHDSHARFVSSALQAGKHVFVEKPLCFKREELDALEQALAASNGHCMMVGFNRRFSPHTRAIREAFSSRAGPMFISYRINAGSVPKDSWLHDERTGGGRIIGEVCHFIDWCECVTGSVPVKVSAECVGSADTRVTPEDSVVITIRYEDGSVASIQYVSVGASDLSKERIEIFADGITAILDDFTTTTFHGCRKAPLKTRQDKGFNGELSAFVKTIHHGGEPPIPIVSLLRTTRVSFAILESLRTGKSAL